MDRFYYFFDLNEVLIDRYPAKIANRILEINSTAKFIFIYSEKYRYDKPKNIPENSKAFFIPDLSFEKVEKLIQKYPPNSLTTIAQRIPDMLMLNIFNKKGIPTFIVQHGLWSDKLERISLIKLLKSKFSKFIKYVNYTKEICAINSFPFTKVLKELYHFLIKEDIQIPATKYIKSNELRAKTVFAFDESWDDYYINKYGYKKNQLIYIGNPDFLVLKDKLGVEKEDAACYICQTLVEDGRYLPNDFNDFLKILKEFVVPYKKLYVKLHPRSRMKNFEILQGLNNIEFTNDFPICTHYIGHYSAMLAVARQTSENVLIWTLKNHYMPEYFNQFASCVTNKENEIKMFLNNELCEKQLVNKFKRLSVEELKNFDPIEKIARGIIEFKKK
ncbi:MAG: hypothetical protein L3J66_13065 [Bacteroidales bacterium]|nr:hypothetical protein [Bacteroidales bacterium]